MTSLVKHLHAFAQDVKLTEEEWFEGIKFLTAVGQKCDGKRQEFILLSDVLGLSMMIGGDQPQDRSRRDRGHGARAVLRARREGVRLRRRPARGRDDEGRGRLGQRPRASASTASRCRTRCSTSGRPRPTASTTCRPTASSSCAAASRRTTRASTRSRATSRSSTASRWTARSATWCAPPPTTTCGRRTCTPSSRRPATSR